MTRRFENNIMISVEKKNRFSFIYSSSSYRFCKNITRTEYNILFYTRTNNKNEFYKYRNVQVFVYVSSNVTVLNELRGGWVGGEEEITILQNLFETLQ